MTNTSRKSSSKIKKKMSINLERKATKKTQGSFNWLRNVIFLLSGLLFLSLLGFATGTNQWTIKYIECGGAPVVIQSDLWSAGDRLYPGDKGYGSAFFNSYECMSSDEKAGKRY